VWSEPPRRSRASAWRPRHDALPGGPERADRGLLPGMCHDHRVWLSVPARDADADDIPGSAWGSSRRDCPRAVEPGTSARPVPAASAVPATLAVAIAVTLAGGTDHGSAGQRADAGWLGDRRRR